MLTGTGGIIAGRQLQAMCSYTQCAFKASWLPWRSGQFFKQDSKDDSIPGCMNFLFCPTIEITIEIFFKNHRNKSSLLFLELLFLELGSVHCLSFFWYLNWSLYKFLLLQFHSFYIFPCYILCCQQCCDSFEFCSKILHCQKKEISALTVCIYYFSEEHSQSGLQRKLGHKPYQFRPA